jgi:hypothetical protein
VRVAYVLAACRVLLLAVFLTSVAGKVRSRATWEGFVQSVRDLELVPARSALAVAAGVVGGESAAVLLLAVPVTVPAGLAVAGVLLAVFIVSIVLTLRKGVSVACRCFGSAALPIGRRHLVRNGLLFASVALAGVSFASSPVSPHSAGMVVAVAAGLMGAVVVVVFDQIVELFVGPVATSGPMGRGSV